MNDVVIFHLKKLWPCDASTNPNNMCGRCGHTFQFHFAHMHVCDIPNCNCRGFMLDLYEDIKAGRKTSEWRDLSNYWCQLLTGMPKEKLESTVALVGDNLTELLKVKKAWFVVGYPKNNLPRLEVDIVDLLLSRDSDQFEIRIANVVEMIK